jgi:hypothetical protein
MLIRSSLAALPVLLASAAFAQPVFNVTASERYLEGTSTSNFDDGSTFTNGPVRMEAPPGMFHPLGFNVDAPSGLFMVNAMMEGGWDGGEFIRLNMLTFNYGGSGGPNTSGSGTLTAVFSYAFTVTQRADYMLDYSFGGSPPVDLRLQITGPSLNIDQSSLTAPANLVEARGLTGQLEPGDYTLRLSGGGTISFVGPGGNGGGAGGNPPIIALRMVAAPPSPCGTSDFNGDGDFGTDQDIEAFFACLAGSCCATCFEGGSDFNQDGDFGTDQDIESFFRVLGGGDC